MLKALSLGAKAVFVGRPVLWGLAYNGREGVELMLNILKEEFRHAMMLSGLWLTLLIQVDVLYYYLTTGCAKITDINPQLVVHESYYNFPALRNKL